MQQRWPGPDRPKLRTSVKQDKKATQQRWPGPDRPKLRSSVEQDKKPTEEQRPEPDWSKLRTSVKQDKKPTDEQRPEPDRPKLRTSVKQDKKLTEELRLKPEVNIGNKRKIQPSEIKEPGYMPTFKIQGQVYHRIGSLQPSPDEEPKFVQLYFVNDREQQAQLRQSFIKETKQNIVLELQDMLHRESTYVQGFQCALEKMAPEYKVVIHADNTPVGQHERRFNAPTTSEVAVLLSGEEHGTRDIVLQQRDNALKKIAETHRSYDPLQYPLLFPRGEDGYNFQMMLTDPKTRLPGKKRMSAMNFYAHRIMTRISRLNHLLLAKELFHQYIVDMYAKIETERLRYIQLNQKKLRVEEYIHLKDAIEAHRDPSNMGQLVILPSSFTGGPRYMHERTQDAMTYVRTYGRPDLFITFTCNPAWKEIQNELLTTHQKAQDRHDLLARVFHLKVKALMDLLTKGKVFGATRCFMYTIEWQKRGLPHTHILLWLQEQIHVDRVDEFISAELPDPEVDPLLFSIVRTQMVHGPCGAMNPSSPCMKDNMCTKKYPRQLLQDTQTGQDGYPLYRRRSPDDGGFTTTITVHGTELLIDNRWIVPYCPLLTRLFKAHINVEYCHSIKSIKYVCKYVNKGSDMAVFEVTKTDKTHDEVHDYQLGRYISSNEAAWKTLGFPIHERHPTVVHLSVHLENGQRLYFKDQDALAKVEAPPETTLTAFFKLCSQDAFARTLYYYQVPKYYTWNTANRKWMRRKVGQTVPDNPDIRASDALGRVYTVHPHNAECFYLRLLLHSLQGPTSFQNLRTVDDQVCSTYKQACQLRGLLEDDAHWNSTLEEAAATQTPDRLRNLFAIMLHNCELANPQELWDNHKESMAEDIIHRAQLQNPQVQLAYTDNIFEAALVLLQDKVRSLGDTDEKLSKEVLAETSYNVEELADYIQENEPKLVPDQREAYTKITHSALTENGGIFFVDAPGGTGKTFLINLLLAKIRREKLIALAVASSGIAATLLTGGKTAHSTFRLPLDLTSTETPTCCISRGSGKARLLQECRLIVWDECTMSHRAAFEALDRTLQDLRKNDTLMGGVTIVLAGDFRQTLPVIPRGTKADQLQACVKSSYLWKHTQRLSLKTNMRVYLTGDASAGQFAENLLSLGNGDLTPDGEDGSPAGVPPHELNLKLGTPVMLMRNLDPPTLCNGTRLVVKTMLPNVIEATVMTGHAAGQDVFIPRVPVIPSDLPFTFKRLQFPLCQSFAITINKAQGQTLKVAGLNLPTPCFAHGQLYVACSRVGNPKNLFTLTPTGRTKNIVYPEVFQH
ncbi:uncharacterized protein [Littorina saxatilis]